MENIFKYPAKENWRELTSRPVLEAKDLRSDVAAIFQKVSQEGDSALKEFTQRFDGIILDELKVSAAEIQSACERIPEDLKKAIRQAKDNIGKFHTVQTEDFQKVETTSGVMCWRESRAIANVGLYIPGGSAPLFSTVLMLAVPAKIAGCSKIILCTPPQENGTVHEAILYTAKLCGVTEVYKVGGAQAIAALTVGTSTVPKVDKIFGPGNQYVTQAKQMAQEFGIAIDLPAGPSEVLVIADKWAVPAFCAADLLAQAEHGADSQVIFVATDEQVFIQTMAALQLQLQALPRRETAAAALEKSRFILLNTVEEAIQFSNLYAPEHLILAVEHAENLLQEIDNAGSVFLGNYTPESAGDYASGTNHTLPTNGFAKNYSGVSLESFQKKITVQQITRAGLQNLGGTVEIMAAAEGLDAHKNAVSVRLKYIKDGI